MANPPPSNPTDFNATAAAAAARIFSPSSSPEEKSPAEVLAESLTLDAPKVDKAVKTFLSLVAARSITATKTDSGGSTTKCIFSKDGGNDPNMDSLRCARALLKAINNLTLPDSEKEEERKDDVARVEGQVVRIVWNALVSKGHKPSKIFGRTALRYAYPFILNRVRQDKDSILPVGVDQNCSSAFFEEFGALLNPTSTPDSRAQSDGVVDEDDHFLLWDADGGAAELQKRRDRRVQRGRDAAAAAESMAQEALSSAASPSLMENASSVTIEEIVEDEEGENEHSD